MARSYLTLSAAALALVMASGIAPAGEISGTAVTTWPDSRALCVDLPENRSRHVSRFCLAQVGIKWRFGVFGGSPLLAVSTKWDRHPAIWLRGDAKSSHGRPIGGFSPEVQAAFKDISLTGLDLAVNLLAKGGAAAVGMGLVPNAGTLKDAGSDYPASTPSAYSWDRFVVNMPHGEACRYAKDGGNPAFHPEKVAKSIQKGGFELSGLQVCGASVAGLPALNSALKKTCEAWASQKETDACKAGKTKKNVAAKESAQPSETKVSSFAQVEPARKPKAPPKPARERTAPTTSNLDSLLAGVEAPEPAPGKAASTAPKTASAQQKRTITRPAYSMQERPAEAPGNRSIVGEWFYTDDFKKQRFSSYAKGLGRTLFKSDGVFFHHNGNVNGGRASGTWRDAGNGRIEVSGKIDRYDGGGAFTISVQMTAADQFEVIAKNGIGFHYTKFVRPRSSEVKELAGSWTESSGSLSDPDGYRKDYAMTIQADGRAKVSFQFGRDHHTETGRVLPRGEGYFYYDSDWDWDWDLILFSKNINEIQVTRNNRYRESTGILSRDNPIKEKAPAPVAAKAPAEAVAANSPTQPAPAKRKSTGDSLEDLLAGVDAATGGAETPAEQAAPKKGLEALLANVETGHAETVQNQEAVAQQQAAAAAQKHCQAQAKKLDRKVSEFERFLKKKPGIFDKGRGGGNCSGLVKEMYQHIKDASYDPSHYYYAGNSARGYLGKMSGWIGACVSSRKSRLSKLKKAVAKIDFKGCTFGGKGPKAQMAALSKAVGRGNSAYAKEASKAKRINSAWIQAADNRRNRSWANFYRELGARVNSVNDLLKDTQRHDGSAFKDFSKWRKSRTVTTTTESLTLTRKTTTTTTRKQPRSAPRRTVKKSCAEDLYSSPEYSSCTRRHYNKEISSKEAEACWKVARAAVVARNKIACNNNRKPTGGAIQQ